MQISDIEIPIYEFRMNAWIITSVSLRLFKANALHIVNNLLIRYGVSIYMNKRLTNKNHEISRLRSSKTFNH